MDPAHDPGRRGPAAAGGHRPAPRSRCRPTRPRPRMVSLDPAAARRRRSTWTWCSRCCTARTARTAPSRGCWSWPACPTSAPGCWPPPPRWTRSSPRSCWPPRACRWATGWCCGRAWPTLTADRAGAAGAAGVRQAGPGRLVAGRQPGRRLGRPGRARSTTPGRPTRRCWSRRRCSAGRSSAGCWSTRTAGSRRRRPRRSTSAATTTFYDFDAKYLDDVATFDIPADLPDEVDRADPGAGRAGVPALDAQGLARVDFFVRPRRRGGDQRGEHPARLHPDLDVPARCGRKAGVAYRELITVLIRTALARGTGLR